MKNLLALINSTFLKENVLLLPEVWKIWTMIKEILPEFLKNKTLLKENPLKCLNFWGISALLKANQLTKCLNSWRISTFLLKNLLAIY
jgi:hypothetical protein